MTDIQRWKMIGDADIEDDLGKWVTYADHAEALREAEQRGDQRYIAGHADGYEQGQRDAVSLALRYLQTHSLDDALIYLEAGGM